MAGFIKIPTVSLEKFNALQKLTGVLWKPKLLDRELKSQQAKLDSELHELNLQLKIENNKQQTPHSKGCRTISWHNSITTRSKKKSRKGHYRLKYTNNFKRLYDGVHAVSELKRKWYKELCKAVLAEIRYTSQIESQSEDEHWDFKRKQNRH